MNSRPCMAMDLSLMCPSCFFCTAGATKGPLAKSQRGPGTYTLGRRPLVKALTYYFFTVLHSTHRRLPTCHKRVLLQGDGDALGR